VQARSARRRDALRCPQRKERGGAYCGGRPPTACLLFVRFLAKPGFWLGSFLLGSVPISILAALAWVMTFCVVCLSVHPTCRSIATNAQIKVFHCMTARSAFCFRGLTAALQNSTHGKNRNGSLDKGSMTILLYSTHIAVSGSVRDSPWSLWIINRQKSHYQYAHVMRTRDKNQRLVLRYLTYRNIEQTSSEFRFAFSITFHLSEYQCTVFFPTPYFRITRPVTVSRERKLYLLLPTLIWLIKL